MAERFVTDERAARRENLITALGVAAAGPLLLWLTRGERDPLLLAGIGLAAAALTYGLYAWRYRRDGLRWLELDERGLEIGRARGTTVVPWDTVTAARRSVYGGEHWVLTTTGRPRHHVLRLDGFPPAVAARLGAQLRERLGERAR